MLSSYQLKKMLLNYEIDKVTKEEEIASFKQSSRDVKLDGLPPLRAAWWFTQRGLQLSIKELELELIESNLSETKRQLEEATQK